MIKLNFADSMIELSGLTSYTDILVHLLNSWFFIDIYKLVSLCPPPPPLPSFSCLCCVINILCDCPMEYLQDVNEAF